MSQEQPQNPLHGITLKAILEDLVKRRGWSYLAARIEIRCFMFEPSIRSSLKFLRRTDWARKKVEALYLNDQKTIGKTEDRKISGSTEVRDSAASPTID
jgi:uncharacterized protein (DUF2132 family)